MHNRQKTHCKNGHPFDAQNTRYVMRRTRDGVMQEQRQCKACHLLACKNYNVYKRVYPSKRALGST